ncbi:hypothetical protein [Maridesulfovibrio ferrireducens]|uniref:hypothetical protein n=1 Tax=Maridesulfovibrio ferrireducens TaxID=246191 RepID=UPI001A22AF03|nr:hypothetical protein [Maridesulfovibrio ferrireducens]MBI9113327.1 hypothetical protein [Maridesulfovibrio ferrireducens]
MRKKVCIALSVIIFAVMGMILSGNVSANDLDDGIGFEDELHFGNDLGKKVNILYMKQKGQAKKVPRRSVWNSVIP